MMKFLVISNVILNESSYVRRLCSTRQIAEDTIEGLKKAEGAESECIEYDILMLQEDGNIESHAVGCSC